ncbi:MAG: hypothetical protein KME13_01620 [Myxacorys californica WJT36-NPBG1]|jgi:hypothetical protein|nr:hypothetical protein [Myxacorys californica WJT36-NPBG1]
MVAQLAQGLKGLSAALLLNLAVVPISAAHNSVGTDQPAISAERNVRTNVKTAQAAPRTAQSATCKVTPPTNLKKTNRYGIFGNDQFDTVVCGYLITRQEEIFEQNVNVAYFRINKFYDPGFKTAIKKGVDSGNSVNSVSNGVYDFNLGCLDRGRIVGDMMQENKVYITPADQKRILNTSVSQPVSLVLSFDVHGGADCTCCNLAEQVRVLR